jgi:5-methylcytosine-specific restriction protein A
MNFRRFDPFYIRQGKTGLKSGGKGEEEVWNTYHNDLVALSLAAEAIVSNINSPEVITLSDDEDFIEAPEGRILTAVHRRRERNQKLVLKKKEAVLRETTRLRCECCSFDFKEFYGERGSGFIEVHHIKPLHTLTTGDKTKLSDLALVCSNCHRMIHSRRPWLEVSELRQLIGLARTSS